MANYFLTYEQPHLSTGHEPLKDPMSQRASSNPTVTTSEAEADFALLAAMLENLKALLPAEKYAELTAALERRRAQGIYVPVGPETLKRMVLKTAQTVFSNLADQIGVQIQQRADELTPTTAPTARVKTRTTYAFDTIALQLRLLENRLDGEEPYTVAFNAVVASSNVYPGLTRPALHALMARTQGKFTADFLAKAILHAPEAERGERIALLARLYQKKVQTVQTMACKTNIWKRAQKPQS